MVHDVDRSRRPWLGLRQLVGVGLTGERDPSLAYWAGHRDRRAQPAGFHRFPRDCDRRTAQPRFHALVRRRDPRRGDQRHAFHPHVLGVCHRAERNPPRVHRRRLDPRQDRGQRLRADQRDPATVVLRQAPQRFHGRQCERQVLRPGEPRQLLPRRHPRHRRRVLQEFHHVLGQPPRPHSTVRVAGDAHVPLQFELPLRRSLVRAQRRDPAVDVVVQFGERRSSVRPSLRTPWWHKGSDRPSHGRQDAPRRPAAHWAVRVRRWSTGGPARVDQRSWAPMRAAHPYDPTVRDIYTNDSRTPPRVTNLAPGRANGARQYRVRRS
ncbi:hypothetical protein SUDANB95_02795 [Actinosynnema sp. ALI-1.44]